MDNTPLTDWDDMRYLLALEREASALGAATHLGVSHQTVSRRLTRLENRLAVRLIDRSGAAWTLTTSGEALAALAAGMEINWQHALRVARKDATGMKGKVRITTAGIGFEYFVLPALKAIKTQFPQIGFDLVLDSAPLNIQSGLFDIAVRFTKAPSLHLIGNNAGAVGFAFYGAPDQIAALDQAMVDNHPVALPLVAIATRHLRTSDWFPKIIDPASSITNVSDISALISAIRNGLGAGYLPVIAARDLDGLKVSQTLPVHKPFDVWVLRNEDSRKSAKIRTISKLLQRSIKAELA
jgi:DNA-binding transcriptional LysR family regulator